MKIAVTGLRGIPASWGGIEQHCEQIYSRMAARGHDITIYARKSYVPKGIIFHKGIRIKRLPTINTKYTEAFIHTFFSVLHILFTDTDIIHIHAQGPCLFSWLPRITRPKMQVFFTCHGLDWQRGKWPGWASKCIHLGETCSAFFPHCRIAVSRGIQAYYLKKYGVTSRYIANGVTLKSKRTAHHIKPFGLSNGNFFLFVGRIVPEKRVEDILQSFLMKPRKCKLVIVGESADAKNHLNSLQQSVKNNPAVLFLGYQYGEILVELYSNARAFINASSLEGLPLTLLEALSYGAMCIASDIDPHKEILAHTKGFLFPTGNISVLSECMHTVEEMPDKNLHAISQQSISAISQKFSWDTASEKLEKLYKESLGRPQE